jgi:hypothetical protein
MTAAVSFAGPAFRTIVPSGALIVMSSTSIDSGLAVVDEHPIALIA